jgi:hypothetical protein
MSRDARRGGMRPRTGVLVAAVLASACVPVQAARADEPQGCDKFRWPIERERAALDAAAVPEAAPGVARTASASAFAIVLVPIATASLPKAPEREPRSGTFAGAVTFAAPRAGTYQVNLSDAAWIDLIQGDAARKPSAFSGAVGCEGLRKAVRFDLDAGSFVVQVSGAPRDHLRLIVEPVPAPSD